jgi:hypothetical protein
MSIATSPPTAAQAPVAIWTIAAVLLFLAMISPDSLWIDELQTAKFAHLDRLAAAADAAMHSGQSEAQMPGYILYAWLWEKIGGANEWQLRLSNLPWVALATWSLCRIGAALRLPLLLPVFLVQPFLWAYLNEFRPYGLQMAGGALLLWAMVQFVAQRGRGVAWAANVALAAALLCVSSMLGAVTVLWAYAYLARTAWKRRWPVAKSAALILIVVSALLAGLGTYYAWTLLAGAGGARLWSVGLANIAMAFYEFLGYSGLGPARDGIRDAARQGSGALVQFFRPYVGGLGAMTGCYGLLFAAQPSRNASQLTPLQATAARLAAFLLLGNVASMLALATLAHWPFWGRHLAPVFPAWCLLLTILAQRACRSPLGRLAVAVLLIVLAMSSVSTRLAPRHRHDDYRGAAREMQHALERGEYVWWAARTLADSKLYGRGFRRGGADAQLTTLFSPTPEDLDEAPTPNLIIISKRDIYDAQGSISAYVRDHGYQLAGQLKAFQLWRPEANARGTPADD